MLMIANGFHKIHKMTLIFSLKGRPLSSQGRPLFSQGRPLSAKVVHFQLKGRPLSSQGRPLSAKRSSTFSQGRPLSAKVVHFKGRPLYFLGSSTLLPVPW